MKRQRQIIALLLILLFVSPVRARAVQDDPYVLTLPENGEMVPYAYVTPFTVGHTVLGGDGSRYFSGDCAPRIFRLTGDQGYAVTAYSADAAAEIRPGACYCRLNLEDSTYFSDAAAGKLRAIVEGSFPRCGVEEVQESANGWLTSMGLSEITDLQSGEVILAAQIAIWKVAVGNRYSVNALFGGITDLGEYRGAVLHTEELTQQATNSTAKNIESLYTYFINLEPMAPAVSLISDASITRTVYSCVHDSEGGYTAAVSVTVEAEIKEGDTLTLTASCGGETQEQPLTEAGEYAFIFFGLAQRSAVKLEIHGIQNGADVYLFDAKGEREASQTLLGYDDSVQPVYCQRILMPVPSAPSAVPEDPGMWKEAREAQERGVLDSGVVCDLQAGLTLAAAGFPAAQ